MGKSDGRAAAHVPSVGEGKRGTAGYLGYLLRQAAGTSRLRLERGLADLDVTAAQFSIMTMLHAYPGVSNADLARLSLLTPQTVSATIAGLVQAGLIVRTPHAEHGRIRHLDLTEAGRRLLVRCRARSRRIDRELRAGLGATEEAMIRRWLVRVALAEAAGPGASGQADPEPASAILADMSTIGASKHSLTMEMPRSQSSRRR